MDYFLVTELWEYFTCCLQDILLTNIFIQSVVSCPCFNSIMLIAEQFNLVKSNSLICHFIHCILWIYLENFSLKLESTEGLLYSGCGVEWSKSPKHRNRHSLSRTQVETHCSYICGPFHHLKAEIFVCVIQFCIPSDYNNS